MLVSNTRAALDLLQTTVMCFVDFASAFDPMGGDTLWRIMAADGMPAKLLGLVKAYYASTKAKVRASGGDSLSFEIGSGVWLECTHPPTLFNYIVDWILGQALPCYPGFQVGTNVHVSDLVSADYIALLSNSYWEMHDRLEAVNRHAAAVGMRFENQGDVSIHAW